MKRLSLFVVPTTLIALFTFTLLPTQPEASADDTSKDAIMETMEVLAGNYRQIRRNLRDESKNAETAELLADMIDASVRGKAHLPETATTDDLKSSYRVVMNKLIIALANAENAALAGDSKNLKKYVAEANAVKGEGHELFITEE